MKTLARRWYWWLPASVLCSAGVWLAIASLAPVRGPESKITRANAETIRKGMTPEKVKAILGPPGDYATEEYRSMGPALLHPTPDLMSLEVWKTNDLCIEVCFDMNERVSLVEVIPEPTVKRPWPSRVRSWLRLWPASWLSRP